MINALIIGYRKNHPVCIFQLGAPLHTGKRVSQLGLVGGL